MARLRNIGGTLLLSGALLASSSAMAGTRAGDKELPEKSRDVKEDGGFYDEVMSAHSKGKDGKGKYRGKGHDGFPEQGKGNHYGWHKGHDHDDSYGG